MKEAFLRLEMDVEDLISGYFNLGFQHQEIVDHLKKDGVQISLKTVKRKLKTLNLWRRRDYSDIHEVRNFISQQLKTSGKLLGYRWMWLRCLQNQLVVKQETVRQIIHLLDPEGVEKRKKKALVRRIYYTGGTFFTVHIDGYDKLSPFGICVSGCIDGFSRYN